MDKQLIFKNLRILIGEYNLHLFRTSANPFKFIKKQYDEAELKNAIEESDGYYELSPEITVIVKKVDGLQSSLISRSSQDRILFEEEQAKLSAYVAFNTSNKSFSSELFALIDQKGLTDVDCYKRAGIDRKLFSKIRNGDLIKTIHKYNPSTGNFETVKKTYPYHPKKRTVFAFAIALRLNIQETQSLLKIAGYTLTKTSVTDVILQYMIENEIYDLNLINEALYHFGEKTLNE